MPTPVKATLTNGRTAQIVLLIVLIVGGLLYNRVYHATVPLLAQSETDEAVTYTVQPGDTLFAIARRFETTVVELLRANGLDKAKFIYVGQQLIIPQLDRDEQPTVDIATTQSATPQPSPTLQPRSTSTSLPTPTLLPTAVQQLYTIYTVRSGDSLSQIASRFQTTTAELIKRNGLGNANFVYVGQRLEVPIPEDLISTGGGDSDANAATRLNFPAGDTSMTVAGTVVFPLRQCYLLGANAGQEMRVRGVIRGQLGEFSSAGR